ncbi:MAG: BatA and WFA domain-containing protein [Anaerolineae bacterium]|nr:BatA and WFA domain-containing protein [Anaerolineae bacterium]
MGFLTPTFLFIAGLSIPILILYMLKLRRRDVLVSSTFLWQRLLRDREANAPWQRLRRNLLMLLQLLILALLTVALARPFVPTQTVVTGNVVILLDASASMQATDLPPTRFEAAREAARAIVDDLDAGNAATLIAVGPQPVVLAAGGTDRAALRRALDAATPSYGPADWDAAAALAAGALAGAADTRTVIISDGALAHALPPLPGNVHFIQIGEQQDNLGILALAIREGSAGPQAFLRVANFGAAPAQAQVTFRADGTPFDVRTLDIPAQGDAGIVLDDLPYALTLLEAQLGAGDVLPLDDTAWAVRSSAADRQVLLITPGNLFLERALSMLPGLELTRQSPNQPVPAGRYDLIVHDGVLTQTLPPGNLWLVGPGEATGTFTDTTVTRVAEDDPILHYVEWEGVQVLRAARAQMPPGARVLVEAGGGPLLFVAERPEGRLAVLTFALHQSNLPLRVAFPILTANLTRWLLPQGGIAASVALQPGAPVSIQPHPEAQRMVVTLPDTTQQVLTVGETLPVFAATDRPGVYRVEHVDAAGEVLLTDFFAVNLFDAQESNVAPGEALLVGGEQVPVSAPEEQGRREFWPWLAAAALGVLAVEWWTYHRGTNNLFSNR